MLAAKFATDARHPFAYRDALRALLFARPALFASARALLLRHEPFVCPPAHARLVVGDRLRLQRQEPTGPPRFRRCLNTQNTHRPRKNTSNNHTTPHHPAKTAPENTQNPPPATQTTQKAQNSRKQQKPKPHAHILKTSPEKPGKRLKQRLKTRESHSIR